MLGIYQVDVQLPAEPGRDPGFGCTAYLPDTTQGDYVNIPTFAGNSRPKARLIRYPTESIGLVS